MKSCYDSSVKGGLERGNPEASRGKILCEQCRPSMRAYIKVLAVRAEKRGDGNDSYHHVCLFIYITAFLKHEGSSHQFLHNTSEVGLGTSKVAVVGSTKRIPGVNGSLL